MQKIAVIGVCVWAFLLSLYGHTAHTYVTKEVAIDEGLIYRDLRCVIDENEITLHEIRFKSVSNLSVAVIPNPNAIVDQSCRGGYGGKDLVSLLEPFKLKRRGQSAPLALVNGNFFRTQKSKKRNIFRPIGMLWSKVGGHSRGKLYQDFTPKGGSDLLVVGGDRARKISLKLDLEKGHTRVSLANSNEIDSTQTQFFSRKMSTYQFLNALQSAFPKMTLASQMNMDLTGGRLDERGKLVHYSQCDSNIALNGNSGRNDDIKAIWKCISVPRTLFCGRRDGSISLIVSPGSYVYDLARALRPKGGCSTECEVLFNLDGGGSSQMAYLDPKKSEYQVIGSPDWQFKTIQERKQENRGCGSLRPVDHYFAVGMSSNSMKK